jgi:hypothetical protein
MSFYSHNPEWRERLPCGFFYLGIFIPMISWIPLIWIIVASMRHIHLKDYVRYHCYQAILFNMIAGFLPQLFSLIVSMIANLISLLAIFQNSADALVSGTDLVVLFYWRFIQITAIYALIWTLRGRFTYLPPISQAVNLLLR